MVYNYTKPRGPIAAMYSSPGPCYGLPGLVGQKSHDPRSLHFKGPAYPFGVRHGKFRDDCSPGPCYLLNPKVYKDGTDGTPHYSLYGRQKDSSQFKVPGPGAYSPEKVGPTAHHRHPAYSFGTRHQNRRTDCTPAANKYTLPNMTGKTVQSGKKQSPIYSITGRQNVGNFREDLAKTPGPGTYDIADISSYKSRAALYSMTSRNLMPGDTTQKPGPGAHCPETVNINKKHAPQYSFGIRHSQYLAPLIVDCVD
ncbi:ciliary microtubule associated protein 1A-like [Argopecten irradians]|uniref:ciliary microtubule associated protein 1A-like n=1 Tax=Argopecten irradians TaxID=31199 RepID=UPI00371623D6